MSDFFITLLPVHAESIVMDSRIIIMRHVFILDSPGKMLHFSIKVSEIKGEKLESSYTTMKYGNRSRAIIALTLRFKTSP